MHHSEARVKARSLANLTIIALLMAAGSPLCAQSFELDRPFSYSGGPLAFDPVSNRAVVKASVSLASLIDLDEGAMLASFELPGALKAAFLEQNGSRVYLQSDREIRVYDVTSNALIGSFDPSDLNPGSTIAGSAHSPSDPRVLVWTSSGFVYVLDSTLSASSGHSFSSFDPTFQVPGLQAGSNFVFVPKTSDHGLDVWNVQDDSVVAASTVPQGDNVIRVTTGIDPIVYSAHTVSNTACPGFLFCQGNANHQVYFESATDGALKSHFEFNTSFHCNDFPCGGPLGWDSAVLQGPNPMTSDGEYFLRKDTLYQTHIDDVTAIETHDDVGLSASQFVFGNDSLTAAIFDKDGAEIQGTGVLRPGMMILQNNSGEILDHQPLQRDNLIHAAPAVGNLHYVMDDLRAFSFIPANNVDWDAHLQRNLAGTEFLAEPRLLITSPDEGRIAGFGKGFYFWVESTGSLRAFEDVRTDGGSEFTDGDWSSDGAMVWALRPRHASDTIGRNPGHVYLYHRSDLSAGISAPVRIVNIGLPGHDVLDVWVSDAMDDIMALMHFPGSNNLELHRIHPQTGQSLDFSSVPVAATDGNPPGVLMVRPGTNKIYVLSKGFGLFECPFDNIDAFSQTAPGGTIQALVTRDGSKKVIENNAGDLSIFAEPAGTLQESITGGASRGLAMVSEDLGEFYFLSAGKLSRYNYESLAQEQARLEDVLLGLSEAELGTSDDNADGVVDVADLMPDTL